MNETLEITEEQKVVTKELYKLILWNDDFNNIIWVMNCLVDICKHTEIQAEQLTLIVHHKGSCIIKLGSKEILRKMMMKLLERGLSASLGK